MVPSRAVESPSGAEHSTGSELNLWIPYRRRASSLRVRLFCFPHAGGGASSFRAWAGELSPDLEVCAIQLPGRENRLTEQPHTDLPNLVEELARVLAPLLREPFALFGHSLGALVAFEFARHLESRGIVPVRLFASGHRAPHLPSRIGPFCPLPDSEFITALRTLRTIPGEVFDSAELCEMVLPILRADFALSEGYVFRTQPPLECPISMLGATEDQLVTYEELVQWRGHTQHPDTVELFPGDHFFVDTARASVLRAIRRDLMPELPSRDARTVRAPGRGDG